MSTSPWHYVVWVQVIAGAIGFVSGVLASTILTTPVTTTVALLAVTIATLAGLVNVVHGHAERCHADSVA